MYFTCRIMFALEALILQEIIDEERREDIKAHNVEHRLLRNASNPIQQL